MADLPVINPNWLSDPADQELAVASFKRARQIWQILSGLGLTVDKEEYFPGPNVTSDAAILDFIQRSLMTIYHAAGTCKMGKVDDPMAVVDSKARVIGFQGLRVVDASSFPFLPPGHPQSTVYALAEKIAVDVLETAGLSVPGEGYDLSGYEKEQEMLGQQRQGGGSGTEAYSAQNAGGKVEGWGSVVLAAVAMGCVMLGMGLL
ncbi:uncharacterized protein KY384_007499 [Bacidia gigantensis]|uniref:uncharacterized protein n=1 Tax=Bacidia gigantensis TaxID=2732470 RepID=UPI001D046DD7|nr:uncharacterized protein KY384_007499 [Bacidia gigantensis]KAG8527347.1 hypothetical protein KY384_007499 [Bacidia gigantensis]